MKRIVSWLLVAVMLIGFVLPLTARAEEKSPYEGKVFSINQIYENIWNEEAIGADNTVAVHIRHIREKIEINPKEPRYLKVVWGVGYKVEERKLTLDEIIDAYNNGKLNEAFGTGTAAVVSPMGLLDTGDMKMVINNGEI